MKRALVKFHRRDLDNESAYFLTNVKHDEHAEGRQEVLEWSMEERFDAVSTLVMERDRDRHSEDHGRLR
jgi:hypothetical protein